MNYLKKLLIVFLFLFIADESDAQFVTIPDTNFVNWLNANGYSSCMNGNLMDTTCSLITTTTSLGLHFDLVTDLTGISYFDSLQDLDLSSAFNLIKLPDLPGELISLQASYSILDSLPALPNTLTYLLWINGQLNSLPDLPDSLKFLDCNTNFISQLPVCPSGLTDLLCAGNQLTSLPALPLSLKNLICTENQLTSLPALPAGLSELRCGYNNLSALPTLPLSMHYLDISQNPGLKCLPPIDSISTFYWTSTGITCLPNTIWIEYSSLPTVSSKPICDILNISGCPVFWNIGGRVFRDSDADCIVDSSESKFQNIKLNLYNNSNLVQQTFSDLYGNYFFYTSTGNYVYQVDTSNVPYSITCPLATSYTSSISTASANYFDKDFALECKPGFDIGASSITQTSGQFRPANNAAVKISAGDLSNQYNLHCASGISGTITVVINGPASYINSVPGALIPVVNGDTLVYSIADFDTVNFSSDFVFVVQTDTTAQIGQQVCFDVSVTPTAGDNNPSNNFYSHCFNLINSFDPNDKQVSPVGAIDSTQEWLTYTIRFQNTGTAPAQHIYILDTLDNDVDESSIQLLAYSHEPLTQVIGNVVRFNFPNINLADSTNNEPESHGYVQYKVKPNRNLSAGTQINNAAYIYFDFNAPVQTNTVSNIVDVVSSVAEHHRKNNIISIYPNPITSGSILNIVSSEIIGRADVLLFDMMGRIVYSTTINSSSLKTEIHIPGLEEGIYQCIVSSNNTNCIQKILIQNKEH